MSRIAFALPVVLLAACFGNSHTVCDEPGTAGIAEIEQRDPATGQCEATDQGEPCDDACGPCREAVGTAAPDWPQCSGPCEGLDETQCLVTPDCHAAYQDDPTPQPVFWGCWDMPPSGAIEGACTGLDALTCAEHDDCVSIYTGPVNQGPNFVESFESCQAKPAQSCATTTCSTGDECVLTPSSEVQCVPTAAAGDCSTAACNSAPPTCPSGTTPGVANGCWSGYCIPSSECAGAACSTLTTEAACTARSDCDPIYNGSNCTCDRSGCTCQTETFVSCQ